MADVIFNRGDGVIIMDSTNSGPTSFTTIPKPVRYVIVSGSAAGEYQIRLNNTTFSFYTTAECLTKQFCIPLGVNEVELVAEPTGGKAYLILDQMP